MDWTHNLRKEIERLEKESIPEAAKEAIKRYVDDLQLAGISTVRRVNYVQRLRMVARWIPEGFLNPQRDDIRTVMLKLSEGYAENTKGTYLSMMKKFYRSFLPVDQFETIFKDVKIDKKRVRHVSPDELITKEEVVKMIAAARNSRDRALIAVLYDSGCRIGELLGMQIQSVNFDQYGGILRVPWEGKTGFRNVRIVGDSVPYLRAWLDAHPDKNNRSAILFCMLELHRGEKMDYSVVYSRLKMITRDAGITKRIHPHLFRHSRATLLAASQIGQAPFESQMGWIHGTKQTATYVHMAGTEQDAAVLKAYGIDVQDHAPGEAKPKVCSRCNELNTSDATYCRKCWLPFDLKTALDQEKRVTTMTEALTVSPEVDPVIKTVLESMPEETKLKLLESVLLGLQKQKS